MEKTLNIIGYTASPRKSGSTAWAVNTILDGAAEHGAQTHSWHCTELDIKPCCGCLGCKKGELRCLINDDMQQLYAALEQADALVLGSPIYMGQMSAQAKMFTDRLFAQHSPRYSPHFKDRNAGKKLILLFTQGNPDAGRFQQYVDYTKNMFQLLEFDVRGAHIIAGTRVEPASGQRGLHDAMRALGAAIVAG
jgi:Multimeric flavodoxin WrbA